MKLKPGNPLDMKGSILMILIFLMCGASVTDASEANSRNCCPSGPDDYFNFNKTIRVIENDYQHESNIPIDCKAAFEVCKADNVCNSAWIIARRVCGNEIYICSTTTVGKCKAALKMLQIFPYFRSNCSCGSPRMEECLEKRRFIFNHPCNNTTNRKELDPYPISTLVSCSYAKDVCLENSKCREIYIEFTRVCRHKEGKCSPGLEHSCKNSWTRLRYTPLYGCMCSKEDLDDCLKYQDFFYKNKCSNNEEEQKAINDRHAAMTNFRSTCKEAFDTCYDHEICGKLLNDITLNCNRNACNQSRCSESLRAIYDHPQLRREAEEIAFCICKRTNDDVSCIEAQNALHPVCLVREMDSREKNCLDVISTCRKDYVCRTRLEDYQIHCASDYFSNQCAGFPERCRTAIIAILGTQLREECTCNMLKHGPYLEYQECMAWHRVLWYSPCVVDAHRDFHKTKLRISLAKKQMKHKGIVVVPVTRAIDTNGYYKKVDEESNVTMVLANISKLHSEGLKIISTDTPKMELYDFQVTAPKYIMEHVVVYTRGTLNSNDDELVTTHKSLISKTHSSSSTMEDNFTTIPSVVRMTVPTLPNTDARVAVSTLTTTVKHEVPKNYCVLNKITEEVIYLNRGKGHRFYRDDDPQCTEACLCQMDLNILCDVLCFEVNDCTGVVTGTYLHVIAALHSENRTCVCYRGFTICTTAAKEAEKKGLYMLLVYSPRELEKYEAMFKFNELEAVDEFIELFENSTPNASNCKVTYIRTRALTFVLKLEDKSRENKIIDEKDLDALQKLYEADEESCLEAAEIMKEVVNERPSEYQSHMATSIIYVADILKNPPKKKPKNVAYKHKSYMIIPATSMVLFLNI